MRFYSRIGCWAASQDQWDAASKIPAMIAINPTSNIRNVAKRSFNSDMMTPRTTDDAEAA
jgi:hypothetical protein